MNIEFILSLVRTILKTGGAVFITRGVMDDAGLEAIVGGVVAGIGVAWSYITHSKKGQ